MRHFFLYIVLLLAVIPAYAGIEVHQFNSPELEARYKHLTNTFRCLVCQNESLAESNAPLAKQLREKAYEMLNNGASDKQIVDYMVHRYGDFVLYSPPGGIPSDTKSPEAGCRKRVIHPPVDHRNPTPSC